MVFLGGIRDNREPTRFEFPFQTVTGLVWGDRDGGDELLKQQLKEEEDGDQRNKLE